MKIVQCWDDGVEDDIRYISILRKYRAKASFNLNFGLHGEKRGDGWVFNNCKAVQRLALGEMKDVYEDFTIANHTLTHPHLENIPIEEATREIREGRDRLEQFFGKPAKGFAYPFGTYNPAVCDAVRAAGHIYARTVQNALSALPAEDLMQFHATCHFCDPAFWDKFEKVRALDGVFYFWGHTYEFVTEEDWAKCEEKISKLTSYDAWTDLPDLFSI